MILVMRCRNKIIQSESDSSEESDEATSVREYDVKTAESDVALMKPFHISTI